LAFRKMEGVGNDFIVVDARQQEFIPTAALVRRLADRRAGVGFDQLLVIEPDPSGEADFAYRVWNSDGGEVEQCGNGARCLALLWASELAPGATEFAMRSAAGVIAARVQDGHAAVSMGVPEFRPDHIPMRATSEAPRYTMDADGRSVTFGAVSMGNPHAVIAIEDLGVESIDWAPVATLGPVMEMHPVFPRRANIGFAQPLSRDRLALRVWERGTGETLACGTGACAAVAVMRDRGELDARVTVELPGGEVVVEWRGRNEPAWLSGPARKVFEGSISL
jgi:diaminopimelate epimerase